MKKKDQLIKENLPCIKEMITKGMFEKDVCARIGISGMTLERYKKSMPELQEALKEARAKRGETLVPKLQNALLKVALGYSEECVEEETRMIDDDGRERVVTKTTRKTYPPNVAACHILLKNYTRTDIKPWTDNPVGDNIKKERLEIEKKSTEIKNYGFK